MSRLLDILAHLVLAVIVILILLCMGFFVYFTWPYMAPAYALFLLVIAGGWALDRLEH